MQVLKNPKEYKQTIHLWKSSKFIHVEETKNPATKRLAYYNTPKVIILHSNT